MNLNPIAGIVEAVGSVASDLITTDKERLQLNNEAYSLETTRISTQTDINKEDAKSEDWFQRRWRPAAGWVCVLGLFYQFIVYPFLCWIWQLLVAFNVISLGVTTPPQLDVTYLLSLLGGLLGLGAARTIERVTGKI